MSIYGIQQNTLLEVRICSWRTRERERVRAASKNINIQQIMSLVHMNTRNKLAVILLTKTLWAMITLVFLWNDKLWLPFLLHFSRSNISDTFFYDNMESLSYSYYRWSSIEEDLLVLFSQNWFKMLQRCLHRTILLISTDNNRIIRNFQSISQHPLHYVVQSPLNFLSFALGKFSYKSFPLTIIFGIWLL